MLKHVFTRRRFDAYAALVELAQIVAHVGGVGIDRLRGEVPLGAEVGDVVVEELELHASIIPWGNGVHKNQDSITRMPLP